MGNLFSVYYLYFVLYTFLFLLKKTYTLFIPCWIEKEI